MIDLHGIIYAYHSDPALNELVVHRTSASLPFCSRYRLIDFALSAMTNAGVRDVGVIMQSNYQSLLDHLEGGKDWDLSRGSGGLSLLPPYGLHDSSFGRYSGCMSALYAIRSYIADIRQDNIVLYRSDLAVNLDLKEAFLSHVSSGSEITAICAEKVNNCSSGFCFLGDENSRSKQMIFAPYGQEGLSSSMEVYIIRKSVLISLIDWCRANGKVHFHRDALAHYLENGGTIGLYRHTGYCAQIASIADYYSASMDMLTQSLKSELFPKNRPVYTKGRSSVSTYYAKEARVKNCLIADGCYIEGSLENCIVFRGVRVKKGAALRNCIIMQDAIIGENASLECVISDKETVFSAGLTLTGSSKLPITVPKGKII